MDGHAVCLRCDPVRIKHWGADAKPSVAILIVEYHKQSWRLSIFNEYLSTAALPLLVFAPPVSGHSARFVHRQHCRYEQYEKTTGSKDNE